MPRRAPAPGGRGSVMWPRLREAPLGAEPGRTMAGRGRALLALLVLAQPAWAPDPVSLAGNGQGRAGPAGADRPGAGGGMRPPTFPRREAGPASGFTRGDARQQRSPRAPCAGQGSCGGSGCAASPCSARRSAPCAAVMSGSPRCYAAAAIPRRKVKRRLLKKRTVLDLLRVCAELHPRGGA